MCNLSLLASLPILMHIVVQCVSNMFICVCLYVPMHADTVVRGVVTSESPLHLALVPWEPACS